MLEFACQFLSYKVQVFKVPLFSCFLSVTGLGVNVVSLVLSCCCNGLPCMLLCNQTVPSPWLFLLSLCSGQFPFLPPFLTSGWCQQKSNLCSGLSSCTALLHLHCAWVSCCPPKLSHCLPHCLSATELNWTHADLTSMGVCTRSMHPCWHCSPGLRSTQA